MKIQRKIDEDTTVEAEGTTMIELFEKLSQLEEIFRLACGCCGSKYMAFRTREVDGNKFHEAVCLAAGCGAALGLGTKKGPAGALFPQRKDADGKLKPNGGWLVWTPMNGTAAKPTDPVAEWQAFLAAKPSLDALNVKLPEMSRCENGTKTAIWEAVSAYAARVGWQFDPATKTFRKAAMVAKK